LSKQSKFAAKFLFSGNLEVKLTQGAPKIFSVENLQMFVEIPSIICSVCRKSAIPRPAYFFLTHDGVLLKTMPETAYMHQIIKVTHQILQWRHFARATIHCGNDRATWPSTFSS